MKNKLYDIDSLNREQYLRDACTVNEVSVLKTDYSTLFVDLIKQSESLPFPCNDDKDYTFSQLFKYQALLILEQIKNYRADDKDDETVKLQLLDWFSLLQYTPNIKATRLLSNLLNNKESMPADIVAVLKTAYSELHEDIINAGITDPSLALIDTFLNNYRQIGIGFNAFWRRFPEYYINNVLQVKPFSALPDQTWLVLNKRDDSNDVEIPKHTAFVAAMNNDGSDFCYKSEESIDVTSIKLEHVSSILFQQNEILVNDKKIRYVNNILQKDISSNNSEPTVMFDTDAKRDLEHKFITTGLMIESPIFISEEGYRSFTVELHLTTHSVFFFKRFAQRITNQGNLNRDIYFRLVNNAFYLKISTEDGWVNIAQYELKYVEKEKEGYFVLSFILDYNFPKTAPCNQIHECETEMPALQILINRDASIFPYTWARKIQFNKITVVNDVRSITNLQVINELGQIDAGSTFYPLGMQCDKGSWIAVGNYELAVKPIAEVGLYFKWLKLPQDIGGFDTYYKDYNKRISNSSFKVRTEFLNDKSWISSSSSTSDLFGYNTKEKHIETESSIVWTMDKRVPAKLPNKNNFTYGKAVSGFVRMVLDSPEFGFGSSVYQHLFINSFITRSKNDEVMLLNKPYIPMVDLLELDYKAVETITSFSSNESQRTKLYHITPIATGNILPINGDTCSFVNGPEDDGYLKFGFSNIERYERIRLYAELLPSIHEFEKNDVAPVKWFYNNGQQWARISDDAINDGTEGFLNSGFIDITLPMRIQKTHLDNNGMFWIYAAFEKNYLNYPSVYGFFLNTVKVVAELSSNPEHFCGTDSLPSKQIKNLQKDIPGIASVFQPRAGFGGVKAESFEGMFFRSSNQALFRKRPSTAEDYERMVLEKFPQIDKVKCFPGCDTKGLDRQGVITLAVMQRKADMVLPLATYDLLFDIEKEISQYTSPFAIIDAINPSFEEVMVRCKVILKAGTNQNLTQRKIKDALDFYIAPWIKNEELPSYGTTISVAEVKMVLEAFSEVERVENVSIAVLVYSAKKSRLQDVKMQDLIEYTETDQYKAIKTSYPWYIRVPAKKHLILVNDQDEYRDSLGIGEIEIDNTLIIKK